MNVSVAPDTYPITELAIDPRWTAGTVRIGDAEVIYLRIEHPRLGEIVCGLSRDSAEKMRDALRRLVE
jgi:hypothetical protein